MFLDEATSVVRLHSSSEVQHVIVKRIETQFGGFRPLRRMCQIRKDIAILALYRVDKRFPCACLLPLVETHGHMGSNLAERDPHFQRTHIPDSVLGNRIHCLLRYDGDEQRCMATIHPNADDFASSSSSANWNLDLPATLLSAESRFVFSNWRVHELDAVCCQPQKMSFKVLALRNAVRASRACRVYQSKCLVDDVSLADRFQH